MNSVILRGKLTTAAEVRVTADQNPTTIARFSLAVPDKSHRNHEGNYDTDFIKIVAFNKLADNIQQYTTRAAISLLQVGFTPIHIKIRKTEMFI